jgi:hypothetical protein
VLKTNKIKMADKLFAYVAALIGISIVLLTSAAYITLLLTSISFICSTTSSVWDAQYLCYVAFGRVTRKHPPSGYAFIGSVFDDCAILPESLVSAVEEQNGGLLAFHKQLSFQDRICLFSSVELFQKIGASWGHGCTRRVYQICSIRCCLRRCYVCDCDLAK